jgi:IS5 family transposase
MTSLLYLKHAFNESDEGVVERWAVTPTWQHFSGQEYFEHRWPCDPSLLVRFRRSLGEEGVEQLLASTINVTVTLKLIAKKQLATVIVDSTVMPKAIAHPTGGKMLETARYAHAEQFRRMRKAIKRQHTIVGRLRREIERKATAKLYSWHAPGFSASTREKSHALRVWCQSWHFIDPQFRPDRR